MHIIRQLQYLTLIEYILPTIITQKLMKTMRALESRWEEHIETVGTSTVLPPEFSNRNKKQNKALLINKKLWEITSYLGSKRSMIFSKVFFVFLSVLNQIKEF